MRNVPPKLSMERVPRGLDVAVSTVDVRPITMKQPVDAIAASSRQVVVFGVSDHSDRWGEIVADKLVRSSEVIGTIRAHEGPPLFKAAVIDLLRLLANDVANVQAERRKLVVEIG